VIYHIYWTPDGVTGHVLLNKEVVLTYIAGLLQRLEEETHINTYIVKQKLPKEIDTRHKEVEILQHVLSEPAMSRGDLDALNSKVTSHAIVNFLVTSWSLEHFHVYIFYW